MDVACLARLVRLDRGAADLAQWRLLARQFAERQLRTLADACERILSRGGLGEDAPRVGAGVGRFLVRRLAGWLQRPYVGFGELFRALSYETIGSAALLSRAVAGIASGKAIFCIPGSLNAARLCLDKLILHETGHIVKHAREKP